MTWYTDNVGKFMATTGFTPLAWPQGKDGVTCPGDALPEMRTEADFEGHQVEAFLNGKEYLDRLLVEIDYLLANPAGGIFWIHGWYFQLFQHESVFQWAGRADLPAAFNAVEPDNWNAYHTGDALTIGVTAENFYEKLEALENAGVDVRVMGFLTPITQQSHTIVKGMRGIQPQMHQFYEQLQSIPERNSATVYSLLRLRKSHLAASKVIFNTLSHPLGGAHAKFVVSGNSNYLRAFTGGVDLAPRAYAEAWSDGTAVVEGKAATKIAEFYKALWNEINSQASISFQFGATDFQTGADELPFKYYPTHYDTPINLNIVDKPVLNVLTTADKRVQMYKTIPRKNYTGGAAKRGAVGNWMAFKMGTSMKQARLLVDALVGLPYVWTPRISFSPEAGAFEFKTVLYKAIMAAEKYIFIMDQDLSNKELVTWINWRVKQLRDRNPREYLKVIIVTSWLRVIGANGRERFATSGKIQDLYNVLAKGIPDTSRRKHFMWVEYPTHAKVVLIDDKWVSIGSANSMRRSFYTDIEMGVAVMHETWVRDFRKRLWSTFCMQPLSDPMPDSPEDALGIWNFDWAVSYSFPALDWTLMAKVELFDEIDAKYRWYDAFTNDPDSNIPI